MREGTVRILYVIPDDKDFRDDYSEAISAGIVDVQAWYLDQLDGFTFDIYNVIPERCRLPRDEAYYSHGNAWNKVMNDVQSCQPVQWHSKTHIWVLYVDVLERCGEPHELGAGRPSITMMGHADLEGLAYLNPEPVLNHCGYGPFVDTLGRWRGGTAHELAHTMGVPYPLGCDEGLGSCDRDALMWLGYISYPHTYLRDDDKAILMQTPFIRGLSRFLCN